MVFTEYGMTTTENNLLYWALLINNLFWLSNALGKQTLYYILTSYNVLENMLTLKKTFLYALTFKNLSCS